MDLYSEMNILDDKRLLKLPGATAGALETQPKQTGGEDKARVLKGPCPVVALQGEAGTCQSEEPSAKQKRTGQIKCYESPVVTTHGHMAGSAGLGLTKDEGIGTMLKWVTGMPYPVKFFQERTIEASALDEYFKSLYQFYVGFMYYDTEPSNPHTDISETDFVTACEYILYARLHFVNSVTTGHRLPHRVVIAAGLKLIKPLSEIFSNIGYATINGCCIVPKPEVGFQGNASVPDVSNDIWMRFLNFNSRISQAYGVSVEGISTQPEGGRFWTLSLRNDQGDQASFDDVTGIIVGDDEGFKPEDQIMRAIYGYGHTVLDKQTIFMRYGSQLSNIPRYRAQYFNSFVPYYD